MAETTHISWADMTHNEWIGCTKVSPACDGCYAEHLMDTRHHRVTWGKPGQHGTLSLTGEANSRQPLLWNKKAALAGARPFVFCSSLSDVFDKNAPLAWRKGLFATIRATPHLVWLLLTKRPQNIFQLSELAGGLPSNVAIGTTVEDQKRANINVPALVEAQHRVKPLFSFLSCEPLLEIIDLSEIKGAFGSSTLSLPNVRPAHAPDIKISPKASIAGIAKVMGGHINSRDGIGWIITGGETDQGAHKARPTHPNAFRALRDQAESVGIPFHHKQNGEWLAEDQEFVGFANAGHAIGTKDGRVLLSGKDVPLDRCHDSSRGEIGIWKVGKARAGRLLDGVIHDARPAVPALESGRLAL